MGCADKPRNPYNAKEVCGVDQSDWFKDLGVKTCKLGLEPIPFESNFFDSVSAYDFLEHIPRQAIDYQTMITRFPFLELMSEIHRVLKPNGRFFALTPAYPAKEAFQDPTHVNILTEDTHSYFCGEHNHASRYGFKGNFKVIDVSWVLPEEVYSEEKSLKLAWRKFRYQYFKGGLTHLRWELEAVK
jgi:SAM-dependent methyltransferase